MGVEKDDNGDDCYNAITLSNGVRRVYYADKDDDRGGADKDNNGGGADDEPPDHRGRQSPSPFQSQVTDHPALNAVT